MATGIGTPMHVIKARMQNSRKTEFKNIRECIKDIYKTDRLFGFYRGFKINLIKDVIFGSSYLGTYGTLRKHLPKNHYSDFLAGGMSSIVTWSIFFPLDTIRTSIQTKKGWKHINNIIKTEGFFSLWRGIGSMLIRVFPISACSMTVYEYSKNALY